MVSASVQYCSGRSCYLKRVLVSFHFVESSLITPTLSHNKSYRIGVSRNLILGWESDCKTKSESHENKGSVSLPRYHAEILINNTNTKLHLIKRRITPIIEQHLADTQMGFRKSRGTRDAILQLRVIAERGIEVNQNLYVCFVDYNKAFDRVNHAKLKEVMNKAGIPELNKD